MAISYVGERAASSVDNGTGTTQALTLASGCTAGNTIILLFGCRDTSAAGCSVADSRGNTWTIDVGPNNGSNNLTLIASTRQNAGTLQAADTITVTFGTAPSNPRIWLVEEFSGLVSASYVDKTATATSASANSLPTGTTAATTQADELAVAAWTLGDPTGAITADATYSQFTTFSINRIGGDLVNKTLCGQYKILSATGAQAATISRTLAESYQGMIVTYKAATAAAVTPSRALLGVGT